MDGAHVNSGVLASGVCCEGYGWVFGLSRLDELYGVKTGWNAATCIPALPLYAKGRMYFSLVASNGRNFLVRLYGR